MVLAHDTSKGDRTSDVKITQNITFETMLLCPDTMQGLKDSGFHKPSPIQLYGIPIGKCGFDLLLEAKSGTGKTVVFSIIALEKLDLCKGLQVVILTPTREIASQICDVLKQIGSKYEDLQVEVVMGGLPLQDDIQKFQKPVHIVVASPGRLKRLILNKCIDTKSVRLLVLDEADKLMESNFQSDIKFIHTSLPKQKQVIMSSATYSQNSRNLINTYVQNASHVCPESDCVLLGIEQKVAIVNYHNNIIRNTQGRFKELHKILGRLQFKQCLVFCNYQVRVSEVHKLLKKSEWPSQKLYGQQEQVDRLDALKRLQQYKCRILVATDLAARGIDASNIDLVVNFEPPYDWQTYLHRIGRAGRFGSYGLAITILSKGKEEHKFKKIFKAMELSISMRHLWSDEEFNIESTSPNSAPELSNSPSDNPTTADVVENENSKDIWELLSSKSKTTHSIETLESQCKLLEKSKIPKIEPFSELMLSLENKNCQDTNEDVVFKHIEMKTTSTNRSIVSQNYVTEDDTVIKELKESNDKDIIHNINEKRTEIRTISLDTSNHNVNNTAMNNGKTDENHDKSKILLNLDLPVMFSSSKFKTHDTKRKINHTKSDNKLHNGNVNNDIDVKVNYTQPIHQRNPKIHAINCNVNNNSNCLGHEIHHRNTNKVDHHNNRTNNYYEKEYKRNNLRQQDYGNSHMRKYASFIEQKNSAKLYSNWYNQLKLRIKYIEQAIYIDEMTKF